MEKAIMELSRKIGDSFYVGASRVVVISYKANTIRLAVRSTFKVCRDSPDAMLCDRPNFVVLTRKYGETIYFGPHVVTFVSRNGRTVRLLVETPDESLITLGEHCDSIVDRIAGAVPGREGLTFYGREYSYDSLSRLVRAYMVDMGKRS